MEAPVPGTAEEGERAPPWPQGAQGAAGELAAKVGFLSDPASYPEATARVERIETHFAWVFLTDRHAYKLKKPIRFDRIDFSTLAARRWDCEEELRLNRRLAPGVYLAVVPLVVRTDGALALEGSGAAIEWLVKMVRLPPQRMLDNALRARTASAADVRAVALHLAHFYRQQPALDLEGEAYRRRLEARVAGNREQLLAADLALPAERVQSLARRQLALLARERGLIETRASRVVEGHGDLRPEHVGLGSPPCIIDCLEFDRDLRIFDPLEEVACLGLECARLGAPWVAALLAEVYGSETGDRAPVALAHLYTSLRGLNRAKVVAWHLRDPAVRDQQDWRAVALDYLSRAERAQALAES